MTAELSAAEQGRLATLGQLVETSPVIVFLWRIEPEYWPVEAVSAGVDRLLGYSPEDFTSGRVSWPGITHPEDVPRLEREVAGFLAQGRDEWTQEYRLLAKDGRTVWAQDRNRVIRDASGTATHVQGLLIDITALKQAEADLRRANETLERCVAERTAALRESEERISSLVASMQDEVWFCDAEKRFTLVNPAALRSFGLAKDERVGVEKFVTSLELMRPNGTARPVDGAPVLRALKGEVITNEEEIVRTPASGELRHRQVNASPVRNKSGQIIGSVAVVRDITERKRAEAALRESEERYRMMAEAVPHLAWRCDPAGLTIECNRRWYDYTGQTPKQARGNGWMRALHPDDRARVMQRVEDDVAGGVIYQTEYRIRRASDGVYRWHVARALPVTDRAGTILGWFGSAADIEDQKRAEDVLRQTNAQLEGKVQERTARLQALAAELTQAEHRERRRIAYLLHEDLQQRLAAVTYKVHELRDAVRGASALRTADRTLQELTEAIALTRDLTTRLSPPVLYHLGLRPALEALAEEMSVHSSLSVRITGRRTLKLASDEIGHFAFDAVRELLLNVAKHAGVKSAEVRIGPAGKKRVSVAVCDKGKGMRGNHEGSKRFGLFSIRERAEAMGIGFGISSRPGKGTCVTLILPTH